VFRLSRFAGVGHAEVGIGGRNVAVLPTVLAESARPFDLPEYRLEELFARPVGACVCAGLDLGSHGFEACGGPTFYGAGTPLSLAVLATASLARPVATQASILRPSSPARFSCEA
jgi:hypothetical protein